jgi:cyclase
LVVYYLANDSFYDAKQLHAISISFVPFAQILSIMQRRSFIKNTALTLGALALLSNRTFAALLSDPAYKVKMLTDKIGIFSEKGGTILFAITKEGVIVVDTQFPDSAKHCIDEIKLKTDKKFALLVNTHHHGDHTAGNIAFKDLVDLIVAHENSLKNQEASAKVNKKETQQLYPNLTFDKTWSRKFGKERVTLHYFGKGHTNGDSFVEFEKAKIVHVGDLVFNRRFPYIDKSAGANIAEWAKILTQATDKFGDKTTYVCGHAGEGFDVVITKADILLFRDYLNNLLKYTKDAIAKGITKEEYLKTTSIPDSPEWKGDGISRSLEAAWLELKEGK